MFMKMVLSARRSCRGSIRNRRPVTGQALQSPTSTLARASRHAMEELMLNHQLSLGVSLALLLALFASPSVAQQASPAPAVQQPGGECGGQYECLEDRPMTPAGAEASRSHPQNAQPQEVAATPPTVSKASADGRREANSTP